MQEFTEKKFHKKNNTKNVTAVNKKIIKNENRKSTTTISQYEKHCEGLQHL